MYDLLIGWLIGLIIGFAILYGIERFVNRFWRDADENVHYRRENK